MFKDNVDDRHEALDRRQADVEPDHAKRNQEPSLFHIKPECGTHHGDMADQRKKCRKFESSLGNGIIIIKILVDREKQESDIGPDNIEGGEPIGFPCDT